MVFRLSQVFGKMNILNAEDRKRNLRLDIFLLCYGLSFAVEKLLLVFHLPTSDLLWLIIYGFFSLVSIILFLHDYYHDKKELAALQAKKQ